MDITCKQPPQNKQSRPGVMAECDRERARKEKPQEYPAYFEDFSADESRERARQRARNRSVYFAAVAYFRSQLALGHEQ